MYKNLLLLAVLCTLKTNAQDSIKNENHTFKFKKEKGGTVCINGLEKLEIALSTHRSFTGVNQLHFYGPGKTQGRMFLELLQENQKKAPVHFFEGTFDLTMGEFPIHLGYTIGIDKFASNGNQTFSGPTVTTYFSDLPKVHTYFHILRLSNSYLTLSEHTKDSVVIKKNVFESALFFQCQPFHLNQNLSIFAEGIIKWRKDENFLEFEVGLRHKKFLNELVGFGLKTEWENFRFHLWGGVVRFNISNPNPRHL